INSLKRRVKKLKKKQRSRTHKLKILYKVGLTARVESFDDNEDLGEDASKQGRISAIDADEGITLVSTHDDAQMFDADQDLGDLGEDASKQGRISAIDADEGITLVSTYDDEQMFDADQDLGGEEVFVAKQDENVIEKEVDVAQVQVSNIAKTPTISIVDVTLAQALAELKHTKPKAKAKGIDKFKAKMIKEPVKLKKKDQIMLDKEVALKLQVELQAEFDKEQRLAREKA
nr:hypothetical protein [Tanacetum cinerariifolium]